MRIISEFELTSGMCKWGSFEFGEGFARDAGGAVVDDELWYVAFYVDATNHEDLSPPLAGCLVDHRVVDEANYMHLRPHLLSNLWTLWMARQALQENEDVTLFGIVSADELQEIKVTVGNDPLEGRNKVIINAPVWVVGSNIVFSEVIEFCVPLSPIVLQDWHHEERLDWGFESLTDLEHDDLCIGWKAAVLLEVWLVELRLPRLVIALQIIIQQLRKQKIRIVVRPKLWVVVFPHLYPRAGFNSLRVFLIFRAEVLRFAVDQLVVTS